MSGPGWVYVGRQTRRARWIECLSLRLCNWSLIAIDPCAKSETFLIFVFVFSFFFTVAEQADYTLMVVILS